MGGHFSSETRGMSRLLLAVCFLALASVCLAQGQCFDVFSSGPNDDMPTCCWYSDDTCCPANNTALSSLLDHLGDLQQELYNNVTDNGQNTSTQLNSCLSFYENAMCSICDPSSPILMPRGDPTSAPVLVMCESFCNQWYDACVDVAQISSRFDAHGITNGSELCMYFPQALSTTGPGSPLFNVSVESTNCFAGADQNVIVQSTCVPWYEEPNTPAPPGNSTPPPSPPSGNDTQSTYPATSDADGDGDDDDNSNLYWLFFLLAAVVLVLLIVVVAVVGFVLWKRRQAAAAVTTDSNAYPDLDELDDYE